MFTSVCSTTVFAVQLLTTSKDHITEDATTGGLVYTQDPPTVPPPGHVTAGATEHVLIPVVVAIIGILILVLVFVIIYKVRVQHRHGWTWSDMCRVFQPRYPIPETGEADRPHEVTDDEYSNDDEYRPEETWIPQRGGNVD